jgi:glycosyltransferase involved in cell wall biosynthesis
MPVVTHFVSLRQAAGVEAHFAEFVRAARRLDADYAHGWLDAAGGMHPLVATRVAGELAHVIDAKRRSGVRLPAAPAAVRTWHCRSALAAAGTQVLVIWNRTAKARFAVDAIGAERCIHWEHGAAWDAGRDAERREHLERVPVAIANSSAAARVLQLRWSYRGELHVCRNALRPSLVPAVARGKRHPGRAITLGVAARLYPVKGVALVLHAVAELERSLDVELVVAGEGPERPRLEALAARLGIGKRVRFVGAVDDMAAFYAGITCLVHTPITEAFGLVALEAAAHGCPVVAANVDGLVEVVTQGETGRIVTPSLTIADYLELGGGDAGLPEFVYDPGADALTQPRAVDPRSLAVAVADVLGDARAYEALSASASRAALARPGFDEHVRDVMAVIAGSARRHGAQAARAGRE